MHILVCDIPFFVYIYLILLAINLHIFTHRKSLFKGVHNFVHLNFATALSLALIVFLSGIEGAINNKVSVSNLYK